MKILSLVPVFAVLGLTACGESDDTSGGTMSGGSAGAGSGGSSGGSSGGTSSSGGGSSGGTSSSGGGSSGGTSSSGGGSSGGTSSSGGTGGGLGEIVDFACTTEDGMGCIGYHGPSAPVPAMTEQCEMDMGTVSEMCPSGASGACAITQGGNGITNFYYTSDADELMTAETICTATGGMWAVP